MTFIADTEKPGLVWEMLNDNGQGFANRNYLELNTHASTLKETKCSILYTQTDTRTHRRTDGRTECVPPKTFVLREYDNNRTAESAKED